MKLYELPHVFVVFHPGAGGNFLTNLIRDVLKGERDSLNVTSSGSSHSKAVAELNAMPFTIRYQRLLDSVGERHNLVTLEERMEVYSEHVKSIPDQVQVSWSHDYTNIELYKEMFPNSKIVVITVDSDREFKVASILQLHKNLLDQDGFVFVDDDTVRSNHNKRIAKILMDKSGIMDYDYFYNIAINGREEKYRALYEVASLESDVERIEKIIGPTFQDKITDECVKVRYSDILDSNVDTIASTIETVISRELSKEEHEFVSEAVVNYVSRQNKEVLSDPYAYWERVEEKAEEILDEVSDEYYF